MLSALDGGKPPFRPSFRGREAKPLRPCRKSVLRSQRLRQVGIGSAWLDNSRYQSGLEHLESIGRSESSVNLRLVGCRSQMPTPANSA